MPGEFQSHRSNGVLIQALPRIRPCVEVAACRAPLSYKTGPLWYVTCYTRTCRGVFYILNSRAVQGNKHQGRVLYAKL
jgi:hypothetical protein